MQLREVTATLDEWYPPHQADEWDKVGLVCGDPAADVRRILLAVDPVAAVAAEAVEWDADLIVCHHPLLLRGTSTVAADTPKGRIVHDLIGNGCGLFAAHTNADAPHGGVSEAMASALGLVDATALQPAPKEPLDKIVVFAPHDAADRVREAMTTAGSGAIGDYDSCTFETPGQGRFRPLAGANPTIGSVGKPEVVEEIRIESVCARSRRSRVLAAMVEAHPYEEPAYDVFELADLPDPDRGAGRIGRLPRPTSLREFAAGIATALPETAHGVRVAGDPDQQVETVALCGGAGDFLLDRARAAGADVYVTSDLRHHPASELREYAETGGSAPALIDVAHWAAEWTWLPVLADRMASTWGDSVEVRVSRINTDPWTFRA